MSDANNDAERATPEKDRDVIIGRFVAQYEEGANGCCMDYDTAQELALEFKRMTAELTKLENAREALIFYRDEWQDAPRGISFSGPARVVTHKHACDFGRRAKEALLTLDNKATL